jgi:hypothetical protein
MKVRPVLGDISKFAVLLSPSGIPVIPCTRLDDVHQSEVFYFNFFNFFVLLHLHNVYIIYIYLFFTLV